MQSIGESVFNNSVHGRAIMPRVKRQYEIKQDANKWFHLYIEGELIKIMADKQDLINYARDVQNAVPKGVTCFTND
jgi:hypothetical protein